MPEVVPSLIRRGFSVDADLVYRFLVMSGPCDGVELSRALGLSPRRVQQALEALGSLGIAMSISVGGRAGSMWAGRSPQETVERLNNRPGLAVFGELLGEANPGGVRSVAATQCGRHARGLLTQARQEILVMYDTLEFDLEDARRDVQVVRRARELEVSLRSLVLDAAVRPSMSEEDIDVLDGQLRRTANVPGQILIVDRRSALMPAFGLHDGWLTISDPVLIDGLVALYEKNWAEAACPVRLTARQHAVVALLIQGHTDDTVARRLQLSRRTVAAEVRALMDAYDVTGRLQLGLVLAKRFWTD